ncbi:MAG: SOS response-associated peptidase, partial [Sphingobacteriia bacterium]|nr:SOS response-associated peptidase [Sphingobacteriia bacterium]
PVLKQEAPDQVQACSWGLIPKWCSTEEQAMELRTKTLNAKSETIFEKPSFAESIIQKRCLIYVNGFYEWRNYNNKKYPYFIFMKDYPVFTFGGIYATWINKSTGEIFNSVSIITTPANSLLAQIHNTKLRMPLILLPEMGVKWINPKIHRSEIIDLMQPLPSDLLQAHSVSRLITSRKENPNTAAVMEYFKYPELPALEVI